jgi:putative intracellular protease/amidase
VSQLVVAFVAFDGVQPIDVVGPREVFANAGCAAPSLGMGAGYQVRVASAHGGLVPTESGLELGAVPLPRPAERIDILVLPGGSGSQAASADPELITFVRVAASRCWLIAVVCTGAFIAAAAARLLNGRRVTTAWAAAADLHAEYPGLDLDPDPLRLRDGQVWTSAGVTAGIDLGLALVAEDLGAEEFPAQQVRPRCPPVHSTAIRIWRSGARRAGQSRVSAALSCTGSAPGRPTSACHRRWPTRSTAQFSRLNSAVENVASDPSRECSPCPRYKTLLPSRCGRRPEGIAWRQRCRFVLRRWPIRTWIDDARLAVSAGKPPRKASYPIRVTYTGPSAQDRREDGRPT